MPKQTSLEITINLTINHTPTGTANVDIVDWRFDIYPPDRFQALTGVDRAEIWRKLRDEIEEFWLSAALENDWEAAWNHRLEDVNLEGEA